MAQFGCLVLQSFFGEMKQVKLVAFVPTCPCLVLTFLVVDPVVSCYSGYKNGSSTFKISTLPLSRSPSSALSHPFFWLVGRVPLLKQPTKKTVPLL